MEAQRTVQSMTSMWGNKRKIGREERLTPIKKFFLGRDKQEDFFNLGLVDIKKERVQLERKGSGRERRCANFNKVTKF